MPVGSQTHRPIAQLKAVTNPTIENLTSPITPDDEFTYALPTGTKKLLIRCRGIGNIKFNFTSIDSESKWITIPRGASYADWGFDLTGSTLYFKVSEASQVIEVLTWT